MARRKQASLADDIVNIVGALPWWVGAALVPVTYLVIHRFAQRQKPHRWARAKWAHTA